MAAETDHPLYLVDVFAERKYAGNPLAVVCRAGDLPIAEMQKIAAEMNHSETTFVLSDEPHQGGWDIRIFTPTEELPFAGHPALGTAYVIQRYLIGRPVDEVALNCLIGRIPVTFSQEGGRVEVLWMRQVPPYFGRVFDPVPVAHFLGLDPDLIDGRFPIQEVSTGLPFIIVPLKSLEAVKAASLDTKLYLSLIHGAQAKAVLVFCPETYRPANDLNVRVFVGLYGITEDAATGSGNGCLAGYLAHHRYYGSPEVAVRVEQGHEMGRPSLLRLEATQEEGTINVRVGGRVMPVIEGRLV